MVIKKKEKKEKADIRHVASVVIITSQYSVIRSLSTKLRPVLTDETRKVCALAAERTNEELRFELINCLTPSVSVPKHMDVLELVRKIDDKLYDDLTAGINIGWYKKYTSDPIKGQLTNVGAVRRLRGVTTNPEELFAASTLADEIVITLADKEATEHERLGAAKMANILMLSVCASTPEHREAIIDTY